MISDPGSLRARVHDATLNAWRMYVILGAIVPQQERASTERISRQRRVSSTVPWNARAAHLTQELHSEVRRIEVHLKAALTGVHGVRRGGSDANTRFALKSIARLVETSNDQAVLGIASYLDGWVRRAEAVLHPDRGLHRLPRAPGEGEARCPYCTRHTLRWQPLTGIVICVNPACRDTEDNRPRWKAALTFTDSGMDFTWEPT